MDIFRRHKFNEAMFAKNRTLAIRVGQYQSGDIKEASFDYGYIKGDTYKPGGTCAGSAKIVFTSIITTFYKLDKIHPEIGLLVDGTYEWVKMGEYFVNDIEIDRNRNTTTLDLMDGMFKLNREYVTDLTYPADIKNVIKEICLKTGVELANENMGIASMNYQIDKVPENKKMTFRDVLSLSTQILGMSCFFNREGKLEIKGLTDSGITITADNYFLHGLTRSEVEYQIAGITCKKDKETLTVGLRTGRSLEIENVLMYQSALDNLYYNIKDIRYYPFSLNYQGYLLLDVGQWVTIKTNTGEKFKSPILSQSFNFKGGLRGRISADSKAGNDAQYSYAGTITKKILQFDNFEAQLQNKIEEADREFDAKVDQIKQDFSDQIKLVEAKTEENKHSLSEEINRRFQDFSPAGFEEVKANSEEALKKAGTSADLAYKAKRLSDQILGDMTTFKSDYQADLNGINLRINQTTANNVQMFSTFTEDINGRMAQMSSKVDGKVNQADFQHVKETAQLYERILGGAENDVSNNVSRMVMSNQVFQTEVGKYSTQGGPNMLRNSRADDELKYWTEANGRLWFTSHKFYFNGQKRMFELSTGAVVKSPRFIIKRNTDYILNILGFDSNSKYFRVYFCKRKKGSTADFEEKQLVFDGKPRWAEGSVFDNAKAIKKTFKFNVGDYDDGYLQFEYEKSNPNKWGGLFMTELDFYEGTNDRKWQPSPEDSEEPIEAVRTQVTQLAGSYAIKNLNSAGDLISGINLGANGNNRIIGRATHITGDTLIDNAVIKSAMIDKLKTANFEAGSVTTNILGAEAVTAEKVKFDTAFIQRLVSQQAFINELFAKQATITKIQSIDFTGNHIKGGRISSLNGKTTFDLQSGWIDMNTEAVGIRNRFDNKPLQYLIFGQGAINDVPGAYTQLMSNRNGVTGIEHTSAGIQIWNGRSGSNIQTAITFYGKTMDFMPNSLGGGIIMNTESRTISNLDNIYFRGTSLVTILDLIDKNFKGIEDHFKYNNLGAPGYYRTKV
jgi:hypothetical protein